MDELIKSVSEKAGISAAQAKSAVDAVTSYIKYRLPPDVGDNLLNFIEGKNVDLAGLAEGIKAKLGK